MAASPSYYGGSEWTDAVVEQIYAPDETTHMYDPCPEQNQEAQFSDFQWPSNGAYGGHAAQLEDEPPQTVDLTFDDSDEDDLVITKVERGKPANSFQFPEDAGSDNASDSCEVEADTDEESAETLPEEEPEIKSETSPAKSTGLTKNVFVDVNSGGSEVFKVFHRANHKWMGAPKDSSGFKMQSEAEEAQLMLDMVLSTGGTSGSHFASSSQVTLTKAKSTAVAHALSIHRREFRGFVEELQQPMHHHLTAVELDRRCEEGLRVVLPAIHGGKLKLNRNNFEDVASCAIYLKCLAIVGMLKGLAEKVGVDYLDDNTEKTLRKTKKSAIRPFTSPPQNISKATVDRIRKSLKCPEQSGRIWLGSKCTLSETALRERVNTFTKPTVTPGTYLNLSWTARPQSQPRKLAKQKPARAIGRLKKPAWSAQPSTKGPPTDKPTWAAASNNFSVDVNPNGPSRPGKVARGAVMNAQFSDVTQINANTKITKPAAAYKSKPNSTKMLPQSKSMSQGWPAISGKSPGKQPVNQWPAPPSAKGDGKSIFSRGEEQSSFNSNSYDKSGEAGKPVRVGKKRNVGGDGEDWSD